MAKAHMRVLITVGALTLALGVNAGCDGNSSIGALGSGGGGSGAAGGGTPGAGGAGHLRKTDKVDILFGIDNSSSMFDKQEIMSKALSDMIESLTNPPCFDARGAVAGPSHDGSCPAGTHIAYAPVLDIHVGVVSSSLGGHGSGICTPTDQGHVNDAGHLLDRGPQGTVPTYKSLGFLTWDPKQELNPPGDADISTFTNKIRDLVLGAGQDGCGYEAQLESWYRFLADPQPYDSIAYDKGTSTYVPHGIDETVLTQRAAFLRPDSLLIIAMLSDEDDCSIKEYGFFPQVLELEVGGAPFQMPRPRAECAVDPNDKCCSSCASPAPSGCPVDSTCALNGGFLIPDADKVNLRCWDQKRRFGIDFSYPADRYIAALTTDKVPNRSGELVDNPIYSYLNASDHDKPLRDPGLVILTGIVGVPWQDVARNGSLIDGLKNDDELATVVNGHSTWDDLIGDPASNTPPFDPFMIASMDPRSGENPFTSAPILPPNSSQMNSINGHEFTTDAEVGDLEYTCIFPLPKPRDCSSGIGSCDCGESPANNPVCDPDHPATQTSAKAYPGARQLAVLKGMGAQGVVASICPSNQTDESRVDYGYRPAMRAVVERVSERLQSDE